MLLGALARQRVDHGEALRGCIRCERRTRESCDDRGCHEFCRHGAASRLFPIPGILERMRRLALILPLVLLSLPAHAQGPKVLSHWVQIGAGGTAEARAVVEGNACPKLTVDGHAVVMAIRAPATPEFTQVCAAPVPEGAKSASVADA